MTNFGQYLDAEVELSMDGGKPAARTESPTSGHHGSKILISDHSVHCEAEVFSKVLQRGENRS